VAALVLGKLLVAAPSAVLHARLPPRGKLKPAAPPPRLPLPVLTWPCMPLRLAAALVFQGIGFFDVGLAVFTRRYAFLARHLSRYSSRLASMTDAEVVALLKSRLAPIR
jgi:hypothetical protein